MNQRRIPGRGAGRPPAAPGGLGANAGARGALLLGVAVVIGIVLLQQFDDSPSSGGTVVATSQVTSTTVRRVGLTTVPVVTSTTVKARAKADVKVLVANGAGVRGLGAATTNALKTLGYTTLAPADTTGAVDKTSIMFAEGYEAEAREVAGALTLPATAVARLASPPVAAADLDDAKVLVLLGVDVATSTTTVPGVGATSTTSTTRRP